jgi:hypothetical protein
MQQRRVLFYMAYKAYMTYTECPSVPYFLVRGSSAAFT